MAESARLDGLGFVVTVQFDDLLLLQAKRIDGRSVHRRTYQGDECVRHEINIVQIIACERIGLKGFA